MSDLDEAELHRLLFSLQQFNPLYGDRLANHLPMATIALWRLGASSAQVHRFAQNYEARLQRRPVPAGANTLSPRSVILGTHDFERNVEFFSTLLKTSSPESVLGHWVPRLLPGLGASAFHGLIRTAYAFESGCHPELAGALALWSAEYVCFPMAQVEQDRAPHAMIEELIVHFGMGRSYSGTIIDRMAAVALDPFFAAGVPLPRSLSLEQIRHAVLELYAIREDFTLLHTVTATHAVRMLLCFCEDQHAACAHLWQGILLAVATVSEAVTATVPRRALPDAPWEEISARAVESLDEHVVKLVYTAQQESRFGDGDRYRQLAARKVGIEA